MRRPTSRALALSFVAALLVGGCGAFGHRRAQHHPVPAETAEAHLSPVPGTAVMQSLSLSESDSEETVVASLDASDKPMARAPTGTLVATRAAVAGAGSERLTISGNVTVRTTDVNALVAEVRAHTSEVGGSVVGEVVNGNAEEGYAELRLRLPPREAVAFADWLAVRATLELRNIETADVSREYFDQVLAIKNLHITMTRLQELAKRDGAPLKDVLEAERELTRVRGELERLEGQHRFLEDRIARATLTINIRPKRGANPPSLHVEPELKFELVPRLAVFHFVDGGARAQDRWGGGATVMFSRAFSLELLALPHHGADARSFLFDVAVAGYSDFLGGGRRRFLNPFLGARVGGAWLNGHGAYVMGAEAGVELVHVRNFIVELSGRAQWLVYRKSLPYDLGLTGTLGVGVPF